MSTDTKEVEGILASSHAMLTVNDLRRTTGLDEPAVRAQLKALAQQGQIEHIPGRGRYDGKYGLLRTTPQVAASGDSEGVEADGALINEGTNGTESADDGTEIDPGDDLTTRAVKLAVRNHNARGEQAQEYMGLQTVIADIRAAIGDKTGKIMLGELAAHIATLYRLGEAHREACMTWERSMMEAIGEDGTGSVATAIEKLKADLANAKALADKLEHLLGSERTASAALREQLDSMISPTLESITPSGYLVRAPKRAHRIVTKQDRAQAHAMAAAANGSGRGEVFALIPIGVAKRGASWIPVK